MPATVVCIMCEVLATTVLTPNVEQAFTTNVFVSPRYPKRTSVFFWPAPACCIVCQKKISGSNSLCTLASLVIMAKLSIIFPNISLGNIQNMRALSALSLSMKGITFLYKQPHSPLAGCCNRAGDVYTKHHDAEQMVVCGAPPLLYIASTFGNDDVPLVNLFQYCTRLVVTERW
ncbi:hypothetical protein CDAR_93101 [Caerostris darwini]|uniref:Secreted protein n=1 Tax=Caerostris darwini TaxID=1538125 RepID=A0AAV4QID5_9ARAC|nr:hypothetical protein CDAR_93101 [Caerostris darwini]